MSGATRGDSRAGYIFLRPCLGRTFLALVLICPYAMRGTEAHADGYSVSGAGSVYAPNLYGFQAPISEPENEQLAKTLQQTYGQATNYHWNLEAAKDRADVGIWLQITDGFGDTVAASAYDFFSDEGAAGGFAQIGHRAGTWLFDLVGADFGEANYDKQANADKLLDGLPVEYWDSVMQYDDLGAAQRARGRILADLERHKRMGLQRGGGPAFASFIGRAPDYLLAAFGIFLSLLFVILKKDTRFPHLDRADW